jgi:RsiW-degrading membrane proteinase PrsW (M82 family)
LPIGNENQFFAGKSSQSAERVLALFTMLLGPSLAGIAMTALVDGKKGLRKLFQQARYWQVSARWYAAALLTFPVLLLMTLILLSLFVSPEFTPSFLSLGIVYGIFAGFIEEILGGNNGVTTIMRQPLS